MRFLKMITVVDVLMGIAILMILSGIVLPHFAQSYTHLNPLHRAPAVSSSGASR